MIVSVGYNYEERQLIINLCSQVFPHGMEVKLYAPPAPQFDASIIILLLIAVFTVAMGGFWSGAAEKSVTSQVIGQIVYSPSRHQ